MEDRRKPNFICLLDVRLKSIRLVRRHRKGRTRTQPSTTFTLAVELNALLSRNRTIGVMEMIRDNMVSILHSRRSKEAVGIEKPPMFTTLALKRYEFSKSDVFIVFLTLLVLEIQFDSSDPILEFLKDESYSILVLCGLIEEVESYVKGHIRHELQKDHNKSKPNSPTDIQPQRSEPTGTPEATINSQDSTLNSSPGSSLDGKSSATEMDSSFDDLKGSQSYEKIPQFSEDGDILSVTAFDSYYRLSDRLSGSTFSRILTLGSLQLLLALHFDRTKEQEEFLTELNNLRHNDPLDDTDDEIDTGGVKHADFEVRMSPVKARVHYQSLKSPLKSPLKSSLKPHNDVEDPETLDLINRLQELESQLENLDLGDLKDVTQLKDLINLSDIPFLLKSPSPLLHNNVKTKLLALSLAQPPVHDDDEFAFSPPPLYKTLSKKSLASSITGREDGLTFAFSPPPLRKTLSKKLLHTSITQPVERDDELAYAFSSEDAPNYIREDKKFKYIRVGKVQKLVNLFEESVRDDSRSPSRCSSPAK